MTVWERGPCGRLGFEAVLGQRAGRRVRPCQQRKRRETLPPLARTEEGPHEDRTWPGWHPDLRLPASRTRRRRCLLFNPPNPWDFLGEAQANGDGIFDSIVFSSSTISRRRVAHRVDGPLGWVLPRFALQSAGAGREQPSSRRGLSWVVTNCPDLPRGAFSPVAHSFPERPFPGPQGPSCRGLASYVPTALQGHVHSPVLPRGTHPCSPASRPQIPARGQPPTLLPLGSTSPPLVHESWAGPGVPRLSSRGTQSYTAENSCFFGPLQSCRVMLVPITLLWPKLIVLFHL